MKHVVILFDDRDEHVAERLEKSLALMQRNGELKTYSSLHISPGQNIEETIASQIESSEVSIIVLSIDLNQEVIFKMIERHKIGKTDLFVVYANYVDEALISEFQIRNIPITPIMPIAQYENRDFAYQKVVRAIRRRLVATKISGHKNRKRLLILLAARRKTTNE